MALVLLNVADKADRILLRLGWPQAPDNASMDIDAVANWLGMMAEEVAQKNSVDAVLHNAVLPTDWGGPFYLRLSFAPGLAARDLAAFLRTAQKHVPRLAQHVMPWDTPYSLESAAAWELPVPTTFLDPIEDAGAGHNG